MNKEIKQVMSPINQKSRKKWNKRKWEHQ